MDYLLFSKYLILILDVLIGLSVGNSLLSDWYISGFEFNWKLIPVCILFPVILIMIIFSLIGDLVDFITEFILHLVE